MYEHFEFLYHCSVRSKVQQIDESLWTKTLQYYSGYTMNDIKPILQILAKITYNARVSKLQVSGESFLINYIDFYLYISLIAPAA